MKEISSYPEISSFFPEITAGPWTTNTGYTHYENAILQNEIISTNII
jgi:hypothetical protein